MDSTMKPPPTACLPRIAVPRSAFLSLRSWQTIVALIALLALLTGSVLLVRARSAAAVTYTTVPLARQDLVQSVTARRDHQPAEYDRHRFASIRDRE